MKIPLALFYERIKGRLGGTAAITATARKLALLVCRMLKHGVEYVRQSITEYEAKMCDQAERRLKRKAVELSYELVPMKTATAMS